MKFTVTGLDDKTGQINSSGDVVNAKGGTEMMKEGLMTRLHPELAEKNKNRSRPRLTRLFNGHCFYFCFHHIRVVK